MNAAWKSAVKRWMSKALVVGISAMLFAPLSKGDNGLWIVSVLIAYIAYLYGVAIGETLEQGTSTQGVPASRAPRNVAESRGPEGSSPSGTQEPLRALAENGVIEAQYSLGADLITSGNDPAAMADGVAWLKRAAETGHEAAQFLLGLALRYGSGTPKNPTEAVRWLTNAAIKGHAAAEVALGEMYEKGQGVKEDLALAHSLFKRSAEKGDVYGQYKLGLSYMLGRGTPVDFEAARDCLVACGEHYGKCRVAVGFMFEKGLSFSKDNARAYVSYLLAGKAGEERRAELAKKLTAEEIEEVYRHTAELGVTEELDLKELSQKDEPHPVH